MKKKIAVLIASTLLASASNAASFQVNGSINNWKSWNAASKSPIPVFVTKAGIDLVQATAPNISIAGPAGTTSIAVTGTIDSVTGYGTLFQLGSFTGYYDVDADLVSDDSYANSGAGGSLTIFNLAWTLDQFGMHQTAGVAEGCDAAVPQCNFTKVGINTNVHDNGLGQSVFDFQGINAGFQTLPKTNLSGTAYGTNAKTWAATPGLAGSWDNAYPPLGPQNYTAQLASRTNSGAIATNAANLATLSLTQTNFCVEWESDPRLCYSPPEEPPIVTPIPAAAWLMGSGLLGLGSVARRKKSLS